MARAVAAAPVIALLGFVFVGLVTSATAWALADGSIRTLRRDQFRL